MTNNRKTILIGSVLAVAVLAAIVGPWMFGSDHRQSTNDAYVTADYTVVAPKVAGFIKEVLVEDNQQVKAGQLLATIDPRDYQAALDAAQAQLLVARAQSLDARATLERQAALIAQAEAAVKAAQAEAAFADHEVTRYSRLAEQGAGTVQNAQQARSGVDQARARLANTQAALVATRKQVDILDAQVASADGQLKRAEAGLEKARLDLSYTRIAAPVDGMVGERALRVGAYVNPGARLLSVVPLERAYIVGNFQETQLTHVQPGQPVSISVDTFSGEKLHGRVESIAPATGVTFAAVKPDNATGNFTKVVQRIPVKIVFDDGQPLLERLRVGMSVEAVIDTQGDKLAVKEVTAR
ncbi:MULTISPECIES: HlyD family secretion protein [unclassified Pseudomonas]|uniref:HlyD family secretion protein n=1 Tax=unclassified Pseudomonas TaxID=196821 RepID=UPI001E49DB73|nr:MULTISPECIES: HlyD family secretion protein [unclassified Pseudomonas]MCE0914827.1 HlyD family secretion protein [Pseudomonas sp. NMI760_13]MCF1488459.1 HlyD family secretion protein [Pseudomonas sp. AA27]MCP8634333.1 HlyD family secretion protein [Pseudomonas sp. DVZ6]MDD7784622.1 HlyD family secretion protein [Pseudomonas sp. DVZ24]